MKAEFDIQLTPKDLYRFNLYQNYTTSQGPLSVILSILVFVIAGITFNNGGYGYGVLYIGVGILFLLYIPVTLRARAKATLKKNEILSGVLHYEVSDEGLRVSAGEDTGLLEWKMMYKVVSTKHNVLIYSNRVNAYILPKEQLQGEYETVAELAKKNLEKYRVKL